jgi:hypothetical protein
MNKIAAAFGQPGEVAFSNEFSYMDAAKDIAARPYPRTSFRKLAANASQ